MGDSLSLPEDVLLLAVLYSLEEKTTTLAPEDSLSASAELART